MVLAANLGRFCGVLALECGNDQLLLDLQMPISSCSKHNHSQRSSIGSPPWQRATRRWNCCSRPLWSSDNEKSDLGMVRLPAHPPASKTETSSRLHLARQSHRCPIMETPAKITFHQLPHSAALEFEVQHQIAELEKIHDRITSCRVTIEAPPRHQQQGRLFGVHIDLRIPGAEIIADRSAGKRTAHEDPHVAVRDAFRAARLQLEDHLQRQRLAPAV